VVTALPEFLCPHCRLRGDLPISDPINAHLRAVVMRPPAPAVASPTALVTTLSGQSTDNALKPLSALDASLVRVAAYGVAQPRFVGADAAAALTHQQALALSARAWDTAKFQSPSDSLVALIRAGKLRDVGFALPRLHQTAHGRDEAESGSLSLSGNSISFVNKAPVAPVISSSQQLAMALFSSILPALIDRPAALMGWITLGRTALAMESQWGWPAAAQYMQRQLASCIDAGRPFADSADPHVLFPILATLSHTQPRAAGTPALHSTGPRSGSAGSSKSVCYNWNSDKACRSTDCKFAHQCLGCGSSDHRGMSCPKGPTTMAMRRPGGGSSASSVTTKNTRSPSSSAAAASSSGAAQH